MNPNSNHRSVTAAAITASIVILGCCLAYRALAARLSAPVAASVIAPEALHRLPMQIGDWAGQDIPLDETIVRKTGTDGHINRRYWRHSGLENVGLYIAYGVTARALAGHRPENCYKGAGWTLLDRQSMEVSLADGGTLPCSVFSFSRGGLNAERIVVLDYFIVDGRLCGDASLLLSRAWRGSDTVEYVAQVQISSMGNLATDSATRIVSTFAADSAPLIAKLFEHTQEDQIAGIPDATKEGNSL